MGIGFGIFLLALGAILAFALHFTVVGVDISIIGWILMAAGLIGLVLTMFVLAPRRRRSVTETQTVGTVTTANPARPDTRTVVDKQVNEDIS
jgi:hypothetical protein